LRSEDDPEMGSFRSSPGVATSRKSKGEKKPNSTPSRVNTILIEEEREHIGGPLAD